MKSSASRNAKKNPKKTALPRPIYAFGTIICATCTCLKEHEVNRRRVEEHRRHVQKHGDLTRVRPVALDHAFDQKLALVLLPETAVISWETGEIKWGYTHSTFRGGGHPHSARENATI